MMNQQQQLLDTIWNDEPSSTATSGFDVQGINIYRRNLLANAQRALQITFPTIFALLDSDVAESVVHHFVKYSPPNQGDWAQWGEEFSSYLATTEIAERYPYLPDCAKADWHVHCALHGKDQALHQPSLQLLNDIDPENITVEFNHNMTLIKTKYPITEIFEAHHHFNLLEREASMKKAQEALSGELEEQIVMIFRPEFQPKVITLTQSESEFMLCAKAGKSLTHALEAISHHRDFSFEQWLIIAIERNLIYYFKEI